MMLMSVLNHHRTTGGRHPSVREVRRPLLALSSGVFVPHPALCNEGMLS
jgi:hypothetical protein